MVGLGVCVHCGIPDCEALFHACLAFDFSDPAYGVVHHLVVGAYMLQHDVYDDDVRTGMVEFILDHLERAPTERAMRRIRAVVDGPTRVRRRMTEQPPMAPPRAPDPARATIADVITASPEDYCLTVRVWAEAVARNA